MSMSHKDYEAIAAVFRPKVVKAYDMIGGGKVYQASAAYLALHSVALDIAYVVFKAGNERFDCDKFLSACGFSYRSEA